METIIASSAVIIDQFAKLSVWLILTKLRLSLMSSFFI